MYSLTLSHTVFLFFFFIVLKYQLNSLSLSEKGHLRYKKDIKL